MKCQTKARGQEKVFIICISKFLLALVARSFQVSAGLSWMCEVSRGHLEFHLQWRIKNPSFFCLGWSSRESVSSVFVSSTFNLLKEPADFDSCLSLGALGGSGSANRVTARTNDDQRWRQMNGSAWQRGKCVWGLCVYVCSLQVDTPQVSRWGDGVALWTQFLVALWRMEGQQSGFLFTGTCIITDHFP